MYGNLGGASEARYNSKRDPGAKHEGRYCVICNCLLFALPPSSLCSAQLSSTELIRARAARHSTGLLCRLALLQVVLWDPFLLVSASTSRGDGANRRARGGDLGLLLGGCERNVGVVSSATKEAKKDEICREHLQIEDGDGRFNNSYDGFENINSVDFVSDAVLQPDIETVVAGPEFAIEVVGNLNLRLLEKRDAVFQRGNVLQQRIRIGVRKGSSNVQESDVEARFVFDRDGQGVLLSVDEMVESVLLWEGCSCNNLGICRVCSDGRE